MKSMLIPALAALAGSAAAKDDRTFAVLRFTNEQICQGRMDPIVAPGKVSSHVHSVFGASGFGMNATKDDLMNSKCTSARVKGDNSAYWVPSVYFKDPKTKEMTAVDVFYANVYYFFDATDDKIEAFPPGLKIVGGDPWTRTMPKLYDDVDRNVKWTCPRDGNNYSPPSWKTDSDGSTCGVQSSGSQGEGYGFPDVTCDGYASPLRADIHMPSCYNPEAGLDDYKNNMEWPEINWATGKRNCKKGRKHVPHLFFEVYWDTPKFKGQWTEGNGEQPFVLSNGDVTGFSSHADFFSGWDTDVLQGIIDSCDAGTAGMDTCPGVTPNEEDCTIESEVDEDVVGPFKQLPGTNPFLGWDFGIKGLEALLPDSSNLPILSPGKDESEGLPEDNQPATNVVENAQQKETKQPEPKPEYQEPEPIPEPEPTTSCEKNIHTEWETVTVTEEVVGEPTQEAARRHLHAHHHGHHRRNHH